MKNGNITIDGGKFDIAANDEGVSAYDGNFVFNNGFFRMTAYGDSSQIINARNVTINNGRIETTNEMPTGIDANEVMIINGGEIDLLIMENESARGYALVGDSVIINGGKVNIKNAGVGVMMSGEGRLEINNGSLSISGGRCGIIMGENDQMQLNGGELYIEVQDRAIGGLGNDELAPKIIVTDGKLYAKGSSAVAWTMLETTAKDISSELIQISDNMAIESEGSMKKSKFIFAYVNSDKEVYYVYSLVPEGWAAEHTTHSRMPVYGVSTLSIVPKGGEDPQTNKASGALAIYVDREKIDIATANDGSVYIDENGRTIVPLRTITEAMGCTAKWDEADQSITITGGKDVTAVFYLNQKTYWVNGEEHQMDTTAVSLPPGRTHVPLRFVAESLGAQVDMTSEAGGTARIIITTGK